MMSFDITRDKKAQYAQWGILFAIVIVLVAIGFGLLLQLLWNIVIVDIFSVPTISFWQAVGLFVVAKLFFGFGIGGSRSHHGGRKRWAKKFDKRGRSLEKDEDFQAFWSEEGKAAYEAYREAQKK